MATRSFVALLAPEYTPEYPFWRKGERCCALEARVGVRGIYVHWDGYPEYNGRILAEAYSERTRAERLLKGGAVSSLGHLLEPQEAHKLGLISTEAGSDDKPHSYENPWPGVTVFYHRDRGEKYEPPTEKVFLASGEEDFWRQIALWAFEAFGAEWVYLGAPAPDDPERLLWIGASYWEAREDRPLYPLPLWAIWSPFHLEEGWKWGVKRFLDAWGGPWPKPVP